MEKKWPKHFISGKPFKKGQMATMRVREKIISKTEILN